MIASIIFIFGKIGHTLFDTSASHLFNFARYVKLLELTVGVLKDPKYIATPIGKSLVTDQVCKSYKLRIEFFEFVIDLIVLGMN